MKTQILFIIIYLFIFRGLHVRAQDFEIETHRISDHVLIATIIEDVPFMGYGNSIILSTQKGIVILDTWPYPSIADTLKQIIRSTFGDKKVVYILNTNTSIDHLGGNSIFQGATLIVHENYSKGVQDAIQMAEQYWDTMIPTLQEKLESLDENSAGAISARKSIQEMQQSREKLKNEFCYVPPTITFTDRMTLDCGDITLQIIYFGSAFTDSDIVIYVPEENLLLNGNAFTLLIPPETFQNPNSSYDRWISILSELLDPEKSIDYIIPTNLRYDYMKKEDLLFIRDYFKELWENIKTAKSEDRTLEALKKDISLEKHFAHCHYFKDVLTDPRFQEWRDYLEWLKAQNFIQYDEFSEPIQFLHSKNIETMWKHCID